MLLLVGSAAAGVVEEMASSARPTALLQLWGTAYDMDEDPQADPTTYGDPEDDPGVKVKRARLGLHAEAQGIELRLTGGASAAYDAWDDEHTSFDLYDASIAYRKKGLGVIAGLQPVPFSRDNLMASGELTFQERGIGTEHLTDDRGAGIVGTARAGGFHARVGVLNSGYTPFGDDNAGKTFVGRVEYDVGEREAYSLWGPGKQFGLGVGGGGLYTMDVATRTLAVGVDTIVRAGPVSVLVDGAWATVSPSDTDVAAPGVWEPTTRLSVTGEAGLALGTVQPAVRVSYYSEEGVGAWTSILAGVVWHPADDLVRLGAGYQLRLEEDPISNDTARLWAQVWLR